MEFLFSCLIILFFSCFSHAQINPPYGRLKVVKTHVTDSAGNPVQLRGMSLYWSQWREQFWNEDTIKGLKWGWNSNVVRAAMAVSSGGYLSCPSCEYAKMKAVIDAAIKWGLYVVVDWHDHNADWFVNQAKQFFANISRTYGSYPHIIYEIWNEPSGFNCSYPGNPNCWYTYTWSDVKNYAAQVIPVIRQNDPNNIIVVGTPRWSGDPAQASTDPITNYANIAYTWHYYTVPHGESARANAQTAINNGLPLFVTEYGTTDLYATYPVNVTESNAYWQFCDKNLLSYCNWHISDIPENTAALKSGCLSADVGNYSCWTTSGKLVNQKLWSTTQFPSQG